VKGPLAVSKTLRILRNKRVLVAQQNAFGEEVLFVSMLGLVVAECSQMSMQDKEALFE
jgi:hypothetical protein